MADQTIIANLAQTIINCDDEIGPSVTVNPAVSSTIPTQPVAPYKKQCLYDSSGNFVGIVDASGAHMII